MQDFFIISSVSVQELKDISESESKTRQIRNQAKEALYFLADNISKYKIVIWDIRSKCDFFEYGIDDTPINRILRCAEYARDVLGYKELFFCSNDFLALLNAQSYFNLQTQMLKVTGTEVYEGYKKIIGTSDEINEQMATMDLSEWSPNEYLIIENKSDDTVKEMRFDGEKFVALKLPPSKYIKAKNSLQRCALDALLNPEISIVAILGTYGSGKTYMAMQLALYNVQEKGRQSKILGVREVVGQGKDVGYLPGDVEDKTGNFFTPLVQSLNGGEYALEALKVQGILETNIPYYMKGTTYNDTIIVCDEAEDLDEKQIRLIGTRLGENSRIYFSGDYKQSVIDSGKNNALVKMCNKLRGNKKFACICLDEDVRSEASKIFADLFN